MTNKFNIGILQDNDGSIFYRATDLIEFLSRMGYEEVANILDNLRKNDETTSK